MPPQGRKQGPRPGDATGREKDRLEKEVRPAIEEAASQVTLTSPPAPAPTDEVVDYSGGGAPSALEADQGVRVISMDEALAAGDTAHTVDDLPESSLDATVVAELPDGRTDVRPEFIERTEEPQSAARLPKPQPRQHTLPQAQVVPESAEVVEHAYRIMRVNTDLPDVTIGKDNHYTFREGTRYRVPAFVYDHLDEKGYVYH